MWSSNTDRLQKRQLYKKDVPDQRVDAEQDIAAPWKNSRALCAIAPSIETESLAPVSTLQQDNVPPPVPSVNF
jgi:hypothetical protein